jgi:hypothetical protein
MLGSRHYRAIYSNIVFVRPGTGEAHPNYYHRQFYPDYYHRFVPIQRIFSSSDHHLPMRPVIRWCWVKGIVPSITTLPLRSMEPARQVASQLFTTVHCTAFFSSLLRLLSMYPHVHSLRRWFEDIIPLLRPVSGATRDQSSLAPFIWPHMLQAVDFLSIYPNVPLIWSML